MRKTVSVILVIACAFCLASCKTNTEEAQSASYEPKTITEQYYYSFGNYLASQYGEAYPDFDYEAMAQGVLSVRDKNFLYTDAQVQLISLQYSQMIETEQNNASSQEMLEKSEKYLSENRTKEGVVTTSSGLQYKVLTQTEGASPKKDSYVQVKYTLYDMDGNVLESTGDSTARFNLQNVINGFSEGLMLMKEGCTYRLFIHPDLAYGRNGAGKIASNEAIIFDVTLVTIE